MFVPYVKKNFGEKSFVENLVKPVTSVFFVNCKSVGVPGCEYGLVEVEVKPTPLISEVKNYAAFRTVKKKTVIQVKHLKFRGKAGNLK